MSDEESFVILGTSPLPSLSQNAQEADSPGCSFSSLKRSQLSAGSGGDNSPAEMAEPTKSAAVKALESAAPNGVNSMERSAATSKSSACNGQTSVRSNGSARAANSGDNSLAASFIMGEINADVLKTSIYSQFPSLCSMEACPEDVIKLQNLMSEYLDLKNTLSKVNNTMIQFYKKTQQWKNDMERMEQDYKQQLQDCRTQIAVLRNENMELQRDVTVKMEQIQICDDLRQKDHAELTQNISEKTSIINNMRVQIENLEQAQLASFEYVPKNEKDTKDKPDYVDRLEHQRTVKELERQTSALLAENLELKDIQKQYIDEIHCLKVNLVAAEELIKQSRADINLLKANDIQKSETFAQYETERDQMREDLSLLRQQLDVYSKDFEMERSARQNLAGEKDQLLQDLRTLQRKNQELIEDAQKQWEDIEKRAAVTNSVAGFVKSSSPAAIVAASTSSVNSAQQPIRALPTNSTPNSPAPNMPRCPVCFKAFKSLNVLQSHANDCLDKNK